MRTRHKIAVIGIFLLGGFTTITGILRLHFLSFAYASLKDPLFNDTACKSPFNAPVPSRLLTLYSANYAPAFYWSTIETNAGIVSACMPTLRPLFEAYTLTSIVSKITKHLSGKFRSSLPSSTDVRLDSMEHGLTEAENQAFGVHQNKHYDVYDGTLPVPQKHAATPDAKRPGQTWYHGKR